MGTTNTPVQIDESFFSGHRKYGRGRRLPGDINQGDDDEEGPHVDYWENQPNPEETYGIDDPTWCWVLGIFANKNEVRFVRIRDRSMPTLTPIIEKYVEAGSVIVTDGWGGYNELGNAGFIHHKVIHEENFVDPVTGYHTQGVERSWQTLKVYLHRAMKNRKRFQSHLDEAAWRMNNGSNLADLMRTFLDDIKTFYG